MKTLKLFIAVFTLHLTAVIGFGQTAQPFSNHSMTEPGSNFYTICNNSDSFYSINPDPNPDGDYQNYIRWRGFWKDRVTSGNNSLPQGSFAYATQALNVFLQNPVCNSNNLNSSWSCLGPFTMPTQTMGLVASIYVDPNDPDNIFAGSNSGGLFKTTDGGNTWINPDESRLPGMGVQSIAVDPSSNNQTIYIATGLSVMGRAGYGIGVLKSIDGGIHWIQTALSINPTSIIDNLDVLKLVMDPNNSSVIFAITDNKVYKTTDGFNTVSELTIAGSSSQIHYKDIQFINGSSTDIFLSSDNQIFQSSNSGGTWNEVTGNLSQIINVTGICISTTSSAFYVFYYSGSNRRCDKFDISLNTWSFVSTLSSVLNPTIFKVSPSDPTVMYYGEGQGVLDKSITSGNSSFPITEYNSDYGTTPQTFTHGDIRCMLLYGPSDNILYVGTDGGILKSIDGGVSWNNLNGSGLNITQFWGFGGSERNSEVLAAGAQDNDIFVYNNGSWTSNINCDAYECLIDPDQNYDNANIPQIMFSQRTCGPGGVFLQKTADAGNDDWLVPMAQVNDVGAFGLRRPMLIHPINKKFYVAFHDVYSSSQPLVFSQPENRLSKISNDYPLVPIGAQIKAMVVSPSNPNYIYIAYEEPTWQYTGTISNKLFRTTNGGTSWDDISDGLEPVRFVGITGLVIDPLNPEKIWITFGGFWASTSNPSVGINRVWLGIATTTGMDYSDYSSGLTQFPVLSIVFQQGGVDALYVGTDVGVFFSQGSYPASQRWECFSSNLPVGLVPDLEINYCSEKIRASVYGRGIWESPLAIPANYGPSFHTTMINGTSIISTDQSIFDNITIQAGGILEIEPNVKLLMMDNATITVESGGTLINIGDIRAQCNLSNWNGRIDVLNGGLLQLQTGSSIGLKETGGILIEEGGTLEFEDGAIIDLSDNETSLEINGNLSVFSNSMFTFQGNGYIRFKEHANLIFGSNSYFYKIGTGPSNKFIRLDENASVDLNGNNFTIGNGSIDFQNNSKLLFSNNNVSISNMKFLGLTNTAIHASNCNMFQFTNNTISGFSSVISLHDFTSGALVTITGSTFENCETCVSATNMLCDVKVQNSYFKHSQTGVSVSNSGLVKFNSCDFNDGNNVGAYFDDVSGAYFTGCELSNNEKAIYSNNSLVFLRGGTIVKENTGVAAIEMYGQVVTSPSPAHYSSMLTVGDAGSCAYIIDNLGDAIVGTNTLLNIDAVQHSLNQPCHHIYPNRFDGNARYIFNMCYTDMGLLHPGPILATNNFWGLDSYSQPRDLLSTEYKIETSTGSSCFPHHLNLGITSLPLPINNCVPVHPCDCKIVGIANCDNDAFTKYQAEIFPGIYNTQARCASFPNDSTRTIGQVSSYAYQNFAIEDSKPSRDLFQDITTVELRNTSSGWMDQNDNSYSDDCVHDVRVAQVLSNSTIQERRANNIYFKEKSIIEEGGTLNIAILPNPNKGLFTLQIGTQKGQSMNYMIHNILGQVILNGTIDYIKSIDLRNISSGVYFLEVADPTSSQIGRKRFVVE